MKEQGQILTPLGLFGAFHVLAFECFGRLSLKSKSSVYSILWGALSSTRDPEGPTPRPNNSRTGSYEGTSVYQSSKFFLSTFIFAQCGGLRGVGLI
jgi:hypothetical protein